MLSQFKNIKTRIFALFVVLIVPVLIVALLVLVKQIQDREYATFESNLTEAKDFAGFYLESRYEITEALSGSIKASIAADAIFAKDLTERDIFYVLEPIRSRLNSDLLMAINADGTVIGQILRIADGDERPLRRGKESGAPFRFFADIESLELEDMNVYQIQDNYYLFSVNRVEVAGDVIGWIGIGFLLDDYVAREVSDNFTAGYAVKFVLRGDDGGCELVGSSDPEIPALIGTQNSCEDLSEQLSGVVRATPYPLATFEDKRLEIDVYGSLDPFFDNLHEWQLYFSVLIVAVLVASMLGAYLIASLIANPVRKLVQNARYIASGNYDEPVAVTDSGELGELAREFNVMQRAVLEREQEIVHRAYHDPLTLLPNRAKLFESLVDLPEIEEGCQGLFLIKVNHVKDINETLGHQTGDDVVRCVGERLRTLENVFLLCHTQMDEFVVLINGLAPQALETWIARIVHTMEQPYDARGMTLKLDLRVGVALASGEQSHSSDFLRMADLALHRAELKKTLFEVFDPNLDEEQTERLALMADLRSAITENQLLLHYQPKLSTLTGEVSQVEALIRWQHPHRGMVRPDKFIEIAESSGQMDELSAWVLDEAARQHAVWRDQGEIISIAVNISAENLKNDQFEQQVIDSLQRHHLSHDAIHLEITESAVVDNPQAAIEKLKRLRDRGFHISIDDYGTGYSSLAQLKHLPVHELKIDKSFVDHLTEDENDRIIVKSTIELAHSMGLSVVAEGVETAEGLEWLAANGCELIQGYFVSRPLPAAEFMQWLEETKSNKPYQSVSA